MPVEAVLVSTRADNSIRSRTRISVQQGQNKVRTKSRKKITLSCAKTELKSRETEPEEQWLRQNTATEAAQVQPGWARRAHGRRRNITAALRRSHQSWKRGL